MQTTQALNIIKALIDASISKGVVLNMEQASALIQAYTVLQNAISKPNDTGAN
jgi:hypothetical protein